MRTLAACALTSLLALCAEQSAVAQGRPFAAGAGQAAGSQAGNPLSSPQLPGKSTPGQDNQASNLTEQTPTEPSASETASDSSSVIGLLGGSEKGGGNSSGYSRGSCDGNGCAPGVPCADCPPKFWEHRTGVFGEYLYLSAEDDATIHYATPVDGTTEAAVPVGRAASVDPRHESGFRTGGDIRLDSRSSISGTYWFYESDEFDDIALPGGSGAFLRPELTHPNTSASTAAGDSLSAVSRHDIDFQMADLDYKRLLAGGYNYAVNARVGVRYATLDQDSTTEYSILGGRSVRTEIDFDGVGPRLGLDGEYKIGDSGFLAYSKAAANFLVGEFRADYRQRNTLTRENVAVAGFDDDRIVSLLEWELGVGWQNPSGSFRVTAGYYINGWFNGLTTPSFIDGVRADNYNDIEETLSFDGLTARAEYRF